MHSKIDTLAASLDKAIQGEPAPPFSSPEFRELLAAVTALNTVNQIGNPFAMLAHEQLGRIAMQLLLERLQASMQSERALAMMRDNGQNLC
jgi:hypothetical protein